MRVRGIVATVLVSVAALIGVGAGERSDPPAPKPAIAAPVAVGDIPNVDEAILKSREAYYADVQRQIDEYLTWQHDQDVAAWIAAHPPAPVRPVIGATSAAPPGGSCNGDFDCFKPCTFGHESGGNYAIVSPGGTYRGAWQFDQGTWNNAVANAGHPEWVGRPANEAPPEIQDAAARWLYSMRGNQPWGGRC